MSTSNVPSGDGGFKIGTSYSFEPPVHTNAMPVHGGTWERKVFKEGWCIGYSSEKKAFVFQDKPDGEKIVYNFLLEWGGGSTATVLPPRRHLTAVK